MAEGGPHLVLVVLALLVVAGAQQIRVGASQLDTTKAQQELAEQALTYQREREASALAVIDWQEEERGRFQALEARLKSLDETHFKEFSDAQKNIARLRDRLATADLRLSVLLATPSGGSGVSAATDASSMVHGVARGELDPAAAQRIVTIISDGDEGLSALQACQAYVREIAWSAGKVEPF